MQLSGGATCRFAAVLDDGVPLAALQVNLATAEGARGLQASALGVGRGHIVPSLQVCHCSVSRPHTPALHASIATYLERIVFSNPTADVA